MSEQREFRRGDVILAVLPFVTDPSQSKARPAVVVQNDVGNRFSANLIVAAISSQIPPRDYPTNVLLWRDSPEGEGAGLNRDSVVQTEVLLTIPKGSVVRFLGRLNPGMMRAVDHSLRVSLGLT